MPDHPSDKIWDEYDWERFLQQQELRTEKYMELLEKYLNHPQRDELIAREMGWTHLLDGDARNWEEEVDAQFEKEFAEAEAGEGDCPDCEDAPFGFEHHPLYQLTVAMGAELDEIFGNAPTRTQEHPAAVALQSQNTLAAAKLAAALNDDDVEELGMSIAYLKRALHAITTSLDAVANLQEGELLSDHDANRIRDRLFEIRGGVVTIMGDYRAEFRRRHRR
jgi:hypothetical protein